MVSLIKPEREGMWLTFVFEKDVPIRIHLFLDTTGCSAVARSFERRTAPGGENGVGDDPIQRWSQRLCQVEAFEVGVMRIDDAQLYVGRRRTRTRATAILDERCSMPMCSRETGTAHTCVLEDVIVW